MIRFGTEEPAVPVDPSCRINDGRNALACVRIIRHGTGEPGTRGGESVDGRRILGCQMRRLVVKKAEVPVSVVEIGKEKSEFST